MIEHLRYRQVAAELRERILDGDIKSGSPIPVINDICHETGVSRETASKAMKILAAEGLIVRVMGHGYYVV